MGFSTDIPEQKMLIHSLDIGCSGYVPYQWEKLGSKLQYYGVDPLVTEIQRLSFKYPKYKFFDCYIRCAGCKGYADFETSKFFKRTSAFNDMNQGFNLVKENFNHGAEIIYTENELSPKEILSYFGISGLDMLKIDVDGDDYAILKGFLEDSTVGHNVLAFEIESQFHGDSGEFGNTFENILRLAKNRGFHLYKLDTYTYSRADKPKPYVFSFPAQTHGGQVMWGDAVFMKDALEEHDPIRISKLIEIYNIYDLDDCAQEARNFHKIANHFFESQPEFIQNNPPNSFKKSAYFKKIITDFFRF